jgi:hypothetical protein
MNDTSADQNFVIQQLPKALASIQASFNDMDIASLLAFSVYDNSCHVMTMGPDQADGKLFLAKLLLSESLDIFLKALIAHACEHGHDSLVLKAMGIAEKPKG